MSEEIDVQEQVEKVEKEARLGGWVPKEDFRDGDHWVDAETFVRRGKEINPILRKNNEGLLKKLEEAKAEIAEVRQVAKEFEKFQKDNADKRVAELARQIEELKTRKKEAITLGDGDSVVALDDAIDVIKEEQAEAKKIPEKEVVTKPAPITLDPIITGWMEDNTWFTNDEKYTRIADAIGMSINQNFPDLKGKAFFDKLDLELEEVLPVKYQKSSKGSPVEGGSQRNLRSSSTNKHTYENLPAEDKAHCDRFIKQGLIKTREDYCKEYDWS